MIREGWRVGVIESSGGPINIYCIRGFRVEEWGGGLMLRVKDGDGLGAEEGKGKRD